MPRSAAEAVAHKEDSDEDGDGESGVCGNGANREDGTNSKNSTKDQKQKTDANADIEPHSVDGGQGVFVDSLDPERSWKTIVTSISKCDSGRGNHATLAHGKSADECKSQDGECCVLRQNLDQIRSPWLSETAAKDIWNIYDGISNDKLEEPAHKTTTSGGHDNGAG